MSTVKPRHSLTPAPRLRKYSTVMQEHAIFYLRFTESRGMHELKEFPL
jgi:hypothetical protein